MGTPDYDELRHTVEALEDKANDLKESIANARKELKDGRTREADRILRNAQLRWL